MQHFWILELVLVAMPVMLAMRSDAGDVGPLLPDASLGSHKDRESG